MFQSGSAASFTSAVFERLRPRRRHGRRGQSLVEFAFAVPVLLLLVFGVIEFGRAFHVYLAASNGAREGARQAIIHPGCLDPAGVTPVSVQARIRRSTDPAAPWADVTPVITYLNLSPTPTVVATPMAGNQVRVQVSIPYEPMTPLVGPILGNPVLSAQSSMVIDQDWPCSTPTPPPPLVTPTATATPTISPTPSPTPAPGTPTATPTATVCATPNAPNVTAVNHGGGSHVITWEAPTSGPAPTGYNVYGGSDPPTTLLNTSGVVVGLAFTHGSGGHRWYGVRAVNSCGEGTMSNRMYG